MFILRIFGNVIFGLVFTTIFGLEFFSLYKCIEIELNKITVFVGSKSPPNSLRAVFVG